MPISVQCGSCGQTFNLRDDMAGRTVQCKCGKPLSVPGGAPAGAFESLINEELSRPFEAPAKRKAPKHRPPPDEVPQPAGQQSNAPAPAHGRPPPRKAPPANPGLRLGIRIAAGVIGLVYAVAVFFMVGDESWELFQRLRKANLSGAFISAGEAWAVCICMIAMVVFAALMIAGSIGILVKKLWGGFLGRLAGAIMAAGWMIWTGYWFVLIFRAAAKFKGKLPEGALAEQCWKFFAEDGVYYLLYAIPAVLVSCWCHWAGETDLEK